MRFGHRGLGGVRDSCNQHSIIQVGAQVLCMYLTETPSRISCSKVTRYMVVAYNSMVQQTQSQGQQSLPNAEDIIKDIPFGTRILFATMAILWITDLVNSFIVAHLLNEPYKVFSHGYEMWRLLTAPFAQVSLFYLSLNIISLNTVLPKLESRTSTVWLLFNYVLLGFLIELITAIITFYVLPQDFSRWIMPGDSCGVWLNLAFKYCYFNRHNKIKMCCIPWMIPKVAYPFVLFAVLSLLDIFSFRLRLDALVGIAFAFLECKFFKANLFNCWGVCELGCSRLPFYQFESWIQYSDARQWPEGPFAGLEQDRGRLQEDHDSPQEGDFSNKKGGIRLSDA